MVHAGSGDEQSESSQPKAPSQSQTPSLAQLHALALVQQESAGSVVGAGSAGVSMLAVQAVAAACTQSVSAAHSLHEMR